MADPLFTVRNHFFLGSYNTVINEASDLEGLSELEAVERDCLVYRSYIALGSYQVRGFGCPGLSSMLGTSVQLQAGSLERC